MKKNNLKYKKFLMQKYLYDNKLKKVKHNLDDAYKNIDKLWYDQLDIENIRYSYISGDILSTFSKYDKKLNILDIGCGYGVFPNYLSKFKNISAYGIDTSKYAINLGKKKYKFKNLNYGDISKLDINFDIKFDVATVIGVFWFMLDDFKSCYKNLRKILKKNGKVYFQVNIPRDNNIFKKKIKDYSDLYGFLNKFFIIDNFMSYEQKICINKKLKTNQDSCIIKCKLR